MAKKRGSNWWKKWDDGYETDLFSNTRKQHAERLKKTAKKTDEDGFYLDDEDYDPKTDYLVDDGKYKYAETSYDYGFNQSFKKKDFSKGWEIYEKSGDWRGYSYYKPATLSYKYIQQMANTIAASGGVKIVVDREWYADLENRTLHYNPASLMHGTKGELLATLLHEVGKISNSMPRNKMTSEFLKKYGDHTFLAHSIFEDVRVDMIMLKQYPSAGEVYESNAKVVKKVAERYMKRGEIVREHLMKWAVNIKNSLNHQMLEYKRWEQSGGKTRSDLEQALYNFKIQGASISNVKIPDEIAKLLSGRMSNDQAKFERYSDSKHFLKDITQQQIGIEFDDLNDAIRHLNDYIMKQDFEPMLEEYVGDMLRSAYAVDGMLPCEKTKDYVEKTIGKIEAAIKSKDSQEVIEMMDKEVYPHIEELLQQRNFGSNEAQKSFSEAVAKQMMRNAQGAADSEIGMSELYGQGGEMKMRASSGRDQQHLPKEWMQGDYPALKESVDYEIKQLSSLLTFIRREENVMRYQGNQRRGKLDMRRLYRYATGNTRIFKKILPKRETVQSFAFSILVDISGSMSGPRVVHAVRGLIVLAEVFTKFDIPFEVTAFDDEPHLVKSFDDVYDKGAKNKIGGIIQMGGGGTVLAPSLNEVKVINRPESNKIVVVLSDGDTEPHDFLDQKYFIPWEKKGVKSIGIGIEVGEHIKTLCHGNGIDVDSSSKLPTVFSDMLKKLIKR